MGARLVKFEFIPNENEQIEAVIKVPEEKRSVIHGIVKDWCNNVVKDAVVKLFEVDGCEGSSMLIPISHTFTDEYGQFLFGPICAHKRYAVKVWFNDIIIRELIITPDGCHPCNEHFNDDHRGSCDDNNGGMKKIKVEKSGEYHISNISSDDDE